MILISRGAGRPDRIELARSIVGPAPLDTVAAAIVAYADSGGTTVYVARVGDHYRWSPAVKGGPYPLSRVVARFLDCPHTDIAVGFTTVDGWCIVRDPEGGSPADTDAVLEDITTDVDACAAALTHHLGPPRG